MIGKTKKIKPLRIRKDKSEVLASALAETMAVLLLILVFAPVLHISSTAISHGWAEIAGRVYLWPVEIQFEGLKTIMTGTFFPKALKNTMVVTSLGVFISMTISILMAYPMSRPNLRGKKALTVICIISMVFTGGMVPDYMVVRSLGLFNTWWGIILPRALSVFNMLIIKNYFEGLPDSVMESAYIDGAGEFRTLFSIVLPMSTPVIATVALLYAVTYWNDYFYPMLYINEAHMKTLQVFVYDLIADTSTVTNQLERMPETMGLVSAGVISAGVTILGVLPIIAFYPFIQRYMVGGITIGSEKG